MRQYKEELEEEIRRKHEAQRAQKMEKMMAERAELGDAQDKLVDGVLKTRQEEREKKELEEAYLAAQSLARKKSGAKAVAV